MHHLSQNSVLSVFVISEGVLSSAVDLIICPKKKSNARGGEVTDSLWC